MMFTSKWRRGAGVALTAGLVFAAVGCSSGGDGAADGGDQECLAMSFASGDLVVWNDTLKFMEPQIEEAGYCFLTHDPQWDAQKQVQDWQTWIARGDVPVIMGYAIQGDALVPVTADAEAAGVTIISYLDTWEGAVPGLTVNDFEDAKQVGIDAGDWINENAADNQTTVAILGDRATDSQIARSEGLLEGVTETSTADIITANLSQGLTREYGYNQAMAQLAADPNTKVWLTTNDDLAKGVYQAIIDSGIAPDDPTFFVGSLDATNESVELINKSDSIYRVAYMVTPKAIADVNASLMIAAAKGESLPEGGERVIFDKITSENAEDFLE